MTASGERRRSRGRQGIPTHAAMGRPAAQLEPLPAARRLLKAHIARLAGLQLPIHVAQVKENTNFAELVSGALGC